MATVAALLQEGMAQLRESSDSARADVEILLCHLLGKPRSFLLPGRNTRWRRRKCSSFLTGLRSAATARRWLT